MYRVYCDGQKIYDGRVDELRILNAKLELELNKAGAFTFTIYPDHPYYSKINKMISIVEVIQDDYLVFKGRVLNAEIGFLNQKQVSCEGELAFFIDSIVRPYEFNGTIQEFFTKLISDHNSQVGENKKFKVGKVTVKNENFTLSETSYKTTLDVFNEKIIKKFDGYLYIRHEEDGTYLDYLEDFVSDKGDRLGSNQIIELGKNLLDVKKTAKGEDIATAIIALGGSGENAITLSTLSDEETSDICKKEDYVYSKSGIKRYGWIFKVVSYSDIEGANKLLEKAKKDLCEALEDKLTVELTSADLSSIDGVNPFRLGRYISVRSKIHDLNSSDFLVKKLSLDLMNPANNKLTIGAEIKTLTDKSSPYVVDEKINNVSKVYNKELKNINNNINNIANETNNKFNEINNYLHLENGNIVLGNDSNNLQIKSSSMFKRTPTILDSRILWSGDDALTGEIYLNVSISSQTNGIVLVFSDGTNYQHLYVPKTFIGANEGKGNTFIMTSTNFAKIGSKVISISNTKLVGTDSNSSSGTSNGITYDNSAFNLKYVIGV